MSGHSKWANIKHKKAAKDAKRGKVFTRIAKELSISAREGGGDPEGNPRLRLAVLNAKAVNMPSDNIKRAIQKGTGEIAGITYEEFTYEGYGPRGGAVILETVTDNKNRTLAEIRSLFTKLGGNLGETNSVAWNFDRKGVVTIKTDGKSEDELLEHVLEAEADDMEYDEESTRVICAYDGLNQCNNYLEKKRFTVSSSQLEYIPKTLLRIEDLSDARKAMKFLDAFEEHDDVQNVYSNYDINDSLLDKLSQE